TRGHPPGQVWVRMNILIFFLIVDLYPALRHVVRDASFSSAAVVIFRKAGPPGAAAVFKTAHGASVCSFCDRL
ncbi:MAG: hypothetical protein LPK85_13050, partial [Gammaproteobacteria bacterium]|nr:hypothetical protein [Gammaproteobacteria bacterium]